MRRWQPGCRNNSGWCAYLPRVSKTTMRVCPGRCAGRLGGRYPGSLDVPAHLPPLAVAKPQARGEMCLPCVTGADD
jgi:hypothetical protein